MAVKTEAVNSSQSQFNLEEYLSRKTYETRRKYAISDR
jgi:hypothetical protein